MNNLGPMHFFLVGAGGFCGALLRYALILLERSFVSHTFPFTTLTVNTLGSFAAGILLGFLDGPEGGNRQLIMILMIGFLGSFTTFSAFSVDTIQYFKSGQSLFALSNIGLNIFLGLTATWLGYSLKF